MVDQKLKQRASHRAKIIKGQVEGLIKAIEAEQYCPELLEQSLAVQNSLKSLDGLLLENHLRSHVSEQFRRKGDDDRAIKELLKAFKLSNK